jgi:ElaB/YqjD/DUF883 family membrane-anchored ribosome-binding protein
MVRAAAVSDMASKAQETASQFASKVQEKAANLGRPPLTKLVVDDAGISATPKSRTIASDLNEYVRANPTKALIGAAAMGFLVAMMIRRS